MLAFTTPPPPCPAALFLYAATHKLFYPGEATLGLYALGVSFGISNGIVTATIIVELYLGVLLLLKIDLKHALAASMALMFAFTIYMWYLSSLASPPSCGCLGLSGIFKSNKHAAFFGLSRNVLIIWAMKLSYDYYFKPQQAAAKPA